MIGGGAASEMGEGPSYPGIFQLPQVCEAFRTAPSDPSHASLNACLDRFDLLRLPVVSTFERIALLVAEKDRFR